MGGEAGASNNTAWDTCIRISPASKRSLQNAPLGIKKKHAGIHCRSEREKQAYAYGPWRHSVAVASAGQGAN